MSHYDAIVIGGGPAGYTAMIYLARENVGALCVEGFESGGQLIKAARVENFPGFPDGLSGTELPALIKQQAANFGADFAFDQVQRLDLSQRPFTVEGAMDSWTADAVILATGSAARTLGLDTEEALRDRGVAYCAICDGPMFSGTRVAVIGGGDAAVEQTTTLTNLNCEVLLVHRRLELRASATGADFVLSHPNVMLIAPFVVEEMLGVENGRLSGLRLRNTDNGHERVENVNAVFVAIGHDPASGIASNQIELDRAGYVITRDGTSYTSVEGVFAAGDLIDKHYRQAVTAAGSGCVAALDTSRWLANRRNADLQATSPSPKGSHL
jgi:thioredoxin reductase (NADPH)